MLILGILVGITVQLHSYSGNNIHTIVSDSTMTTSVSYAPILTVTPIPSQYFLNQTDQDNNILSITMNASNLRYSNFPTGLFSQDTNEWGLINYTNDPVVITIAFKNPVYLATIYNSFTNCPAKNYPNGYTGATGCYYMINVRGETVDNMNVVLLPAKFIFPSLAVDGKRQDVLEDTTNISSPYVLKYILITATRMGFDPDNYVHWKKLKLKYQLPNQAAAPSSTAQTSSQQISLTSVGFFPQTLTIPVGTRVFWLNNANVAATVNSDPYPQDTNYPPLNLGSFSEGQTVIYTFSTPGTYGYHNEYNPSQTGTIIVQ